MVNCTFITCGACEDDAPNCTAICPAYTPAVKLPLVINNCGTAGDVRLTLPLDAVSPSQLPPLLVVMAALQVCAVLAVLEIVIDGVAVGFTPTTPCKLSDSGVTESVPLATGFTVSVTGTVSKGGFACASAMVMAPMYDPGASPEVFAFAKNAAGS